MIRVLFVDDDVALQKIYKAIFPMNSIDITGQAFDGSEAVNIIASHLNFDVVLMDQRMPVMDGVTATRKILELDEGLKVIFLSADEGSREAALASGAKAFLTKPVRLEELVEMIEKTAGS